MEEHAVRINKYLADAGICSATKSASIPSAG